MDGVWREANEVIVPSVQFHGSSDLDRAMYVSSRMLSDLNRCAVAEVAPLLHPIAEHCNLPNQ